MMLCDCIAFCNRSSLDAGFPDCVEAKGEGSVSLLAVGVQDGKWWKSEEEARVFLNCSGQMVRRIQSSKHTSRPRRAQ